MCIHAQARGQLVRVSSTIRVLGIKLSSSGSVVNALHTDHLAGPALWLLSKPQISLLVHFEAQLRNF